MNLVPRDLTRHIQHSLKIDRVIAIMGPRQAGKTTLAQHLIKSNLDIQYYNLKDPDTRRALTANARKEFEYFGKNLIVLDEVQQMPDLIELIQLQVDIQPERKGRFLITGSNHLLLNRRIKESLAGRVSIYTLFPMSFSELVSHPERSLLKNLLYAQSVKNVETELSQFYLPAKQSNMLSEKFREFTLYGGYPEFLTRIDPEDRKQWLNNYRQTYLDTDLREIVDLRNPESFERFEQLFVTRVGSLMNISELARDCALSADTIRRFMNYYRQLFVAWSSLPFFENIGRRMKKMPKWYFMDTGILRSLMNNFKMEDGSCFENSVVSELRKGIYQETLREDIYFARTSTGVEADAVFKNIESRLTFYCEIKQRNTPQRADIRHLRKFVSLDESNVGLLLNMSNSIKKLEERIWNIPVHWLLS